VNRLRSAAVLFGLLAAAGVTQAQDFKQRLRGTVVLHVILEKGGTASQVDVVSGHPIFAQAAVDAVRQWKYQPTMLNGEPVKVDTLAHVKFMLVAARETNP
jgi:TonB family protein